MKYLWTPDKRLLLVDVAYWYVHLGYDVDWPRFVPACREDIRRKGAVFLYLPESATPGLQCEETTPDAVLPLCLEDGRVLIVGKLSPLYPGPHRRILDGDSLAHSMRWAAPASLDTEGCYMSYCPIPFANPSYPSRSSLPADCREAVRRLARITAHEMDKRLAVDYGVYKALTGYQSTDLNDTFRRF